MQRINHALKRGDIAGILEIEASYGSKESWFSGQDERGLLEFIEQDIQRVKHEIHLLKQQVNRIKKEIKLISPS